jgi:hypothetical protein
MTSRLSLLSGDEQQVARQPVASERVRVTPQKLAGEVVHFVQVSLLARQQE